MSSSRLFYKRVALAVTAALGFGVAAVAPAGAVTNNAVIRYATGDGAAVAPYNTGAGVAGPGNWVSVTVNTPNDGKYRYVTVSGASATIKSTTGSPTVNAANSAATFTANVAGSLVISTPAVGTITVSEFTETGPATGIFPATADETVTITVNATAISGTYSAAKSSSYLGAYPGAEATEDAKIVAYSGLSATPVARVDVTLLDGFGAPLASKQLNASLSGIGLMSVVSNGTGKAVVANLTTDAAGKATVYLYSDGRAGTGTVTILLGAVTVASKSVMFFGDTATISAVQNLKVGQMSGAALGTATSVTPAVTLTLKDSLGNAVSGVTPSAVSADSAVVSGGTCSASNDKGVSYCQVVTAASKSGSSTTVTFETTVGANKIKSAAVPFSVGGTVIKSVAWSFDKASYNPGDKATVTVTLKDAAGNPVADGAQTVFSTVTPTAGITTDLSNVGNPLKTVAGVGSFSFYLPVLAGPFALDGVLAADGATTSVATTVKADTATADALKAAQDEIVALKTLVDQMNVKMDAQSATIASLLAKLDSFMSPKTISCVKGKSVKKVTAVFPVCPTGYKKVTK